MIGSGEYAIFARAASVAFGSDAAAQDALLGRMSGVGAAFGWGPENDYVSTLNAAGVVVHASDYNKNLAALSNVVALDNNATAAAMAPPRRAPPGSREAAADDNAPHIVSFVMSDGDNLQWTLGPWSTSSSWFGNAARGDVPVCHRARVVARCSRLRL